MGGRASAELAKGYSGVSNVGPAGNVGIEQFTKEGAIAEAMVLL